MASKQSLPVPRQVALCYVRQSFTRNEEDTNSPERQRANIEAVIQAKGWVAEWYQDAEGHKSGTKEENRPGWLALKTRLSDPDVVAIVANDLSRLHRKGWRVGSLLDMLEQYNVGLVLAAPGRNLDLSGTAGKISTMLMAIMDEYYALDTSQKQKDSVHYRRTKGVIVGPIPFGTMRDKDGYLLPSPQGVWLFPDGTCVEGQQAHPVSDEPVIWRGFIDGAKRCLELYKENRYGRRRIADILNEEGYRFQDCEQQIVLFNSDDVRRITSNWIEYGGAVVPGKAKNRRAKDLTPDNVALHPERAVFDVDLCVQVGYVREKRTHDVKRTPDFAVRLDAAIYPLSKIIYCAHCERAAQESDGAQTRSYLTGKTGNKKEARRYRHDTEHRCGAKKRSVNADLLEKDFLCLLEKLTVNPESLPLFTLALEHFNKQHNPEERVAAIQAEIAHWRQRIKNTDMLFMKVRLTEDEWRRTVEHAEHEIVRLQAQIAQQQEREIALKLTMEMVENLIQSWREANMEVRRGLAHSLFEYVVYNLDTRQIVDFKLKPWAELLMQLKVTLGDDPTPPPSNSGSPSGGKPTVVRCSQRGSVTRHVIWQNLPRCA